MRLETGTILLKANMVSPLLLDRPQVPQNVSTYCDTSIQTQEPMGSTSKPQQTKIEKELAFIQTINKSDVSSKELHLKFHPCLEGHFVHEDPEKARKTRFSKVSNFRKRHR